MSKILAGKKGLITGVIDNHSLAWHIAKRCVENGATIVLSATEAATQLGYIKELSSNTGLQVINCDLTKIEEIDMLLDKAVDALGGKLDFVLHAVAQSDNIRRRKPYETLSYNYYVKTLDTSAFSLHKLLHCAMEKDAINEYGSVVTLTYIASERYMYGYNDMADAKAVLESIVRQMGAIYGKHKKVRVNAVSQSATKTKAGQQWKEQECFYRYSNDMSPLGSADADDCADLCVALFSDLMKKVTMQTIYNDGGFSHTLLTETVINDLRNIETQKISTK